MKTAQAYLELYKALPPKVKAEIKELIDEEQSETVEISVKALKTAIKEVKKIKNGTAKITNAREFLKELEEELAQ